MQLAQAEFDPLAFALLSLPALAALAAFAWALARAKATRAVAHARWPWWGSLGAALVAAGWVVAWREGLVAPEWRGHSFIVLWVGYIVVVNAMTYRRSGRSPLTHDTARLLALFPASAVFWWLFEYLNQFSGNWRYAGIEAGNAWQYLLQASLPFATVLPAVASTTAWLATYPRLDALRLPPVHAASPLAWLALALGGLALVGLPIWPERLFLMLWLAPLLVFAALQYLLLGETLFAPLARGDWRAVLQPAIAALMCGCFWELWNYGSLAKWQYSVPYVERFHLFEMPLLGYAGYLPFGVECALVTQLVARLFRGESRMQADQSIAPSHGSQQALDRIVE